MEHYPPVVTMEEIEHTFDPKNVLTTARLGLTCNAKNTDTMDDPELALNPVARAIRQELDNIVRPEHKDTYLTEQILQSQKLERFYSDIGNREPTKVERLAIRQTLYRIYNGMLNGYDVKDNKERHATLKGLLESILIPFYDDPSHSHIRLGAVITCIKNYLDLAASAVQKKYRTLRGKSINTLKDLASDMVPLSAKQRGMNSKSDHEVTMAFLRTHVI